MTTTTDEPGLFALPDLARLTGHAADYQWLTWLGDALRASLVPVIEYPGWRTRGRPRSVGAFTPRAVMWHHDGSARGPSPELARYCAVVGRPPEVPAPLAHAWVCAGCNGAHAPGTWHLLAAGRANHAGTGRGWGVAPADDGNRWTIGVEYDNTTGEPTPLAVYESLVSGTAGILAHLGAAPEDALMAHKEYAAGRKIDPDDIDMPRARRDVAELLSGRGRRPHGFPGPKHFTLGHQCAGGHVRLLEQWLLTIRDDGHPPSDTYTSWTAERVEGFRRSRRGLAALAGAPMDLKTWVRLQAAAAAKGWDL